MSEAKNLLNEVKQGFKSLEVSAKYKTTALNFLKVWLIKEEFKEYLPQIKYLIKENKWDFILDSFYQIIPFGTGGRRGLVGIGPNRINRWTIRSSAQGHSQYLVKKYGEKAKKMGVVLTYDVRTYLQEGIYDPKLSNPVWGLNCKDLAIAAAEVYVANGLKVYFFEDIRSTPELSFAIRYLGAIAGDMFSASHNPPTDNGKKVYDQHGGQLIPPHDQELVNEVTENVKEIKEINFKKAQRDGLIEIVGKRVDDAYLRAVTKLSLSKNRKVNIIYTPFHGTGMTSTYRVLKYLNFRVKPDPKTSNPSGRFENITFNIPNPEVVESYWVPLKFAKKEKADILIAGDPDSDRIGVMLNQGNNDWRYLNGQEIGVIQTEYVISKYKKNKKLNKNSVIIKTDVTTSLISLIAKENGVNIIDNLLVGFKYIGDWMNRLEKRGIINDFLLGAEESHGYIAGNYLRDKDSSISAIWLSELAGELKEKGETLLDYLNKIYARYGYFRNYLTEIRLLGAVGMEKIQKIQNTLREKKPRQFGRFKVKRIWDRWNGPPQPHLSKTDTYSRNVLVFYFKPVRKTISIRVTVRPSGTEPKIKFYLEIGGFPFSIKNVEKEKEEVEGIKSELEKEFVKYCYQIIGIDFPDRGFLLFWQLPAMDKMRYFEIEDNIAGLKNIKDKKKREKKLENMLKFLGVDPIEKVEKAFKAKYQKGILEYLLLN